MGSSVVRFVARASLALVLVAAMPDTAASAATKPLVRAQPSEPSARSTLPATHQTVIAPAVETAAGADEADSDETRLRPSLESMQPHGAGVLVSALIVMRFSEPMSHPSVERWFAIQPRVDGSALWQDDYTMTFKPRHLLAHGTTYQVTAGGRSSLGAPLLGPRAWTFTTREAPPIVLQPGRGYVTVPVLMYHYIRVNPEARDRMGFGLSVTPSDFAAQMDWLDGNGYHPVAMRDLEAYLRGSAGLPSRPVILTFDDGYADFFDVALPILESHDFRAVAYVVSGFVGTPGYMNAEQVLEADRSGVEIGSHTVDHVDLTRLSPGALAYQVTASKRALESLLGHQVSSFCYPSGRFNAAVAAAVQTAGYDDATTTQYGWLRTLPGRYTWGRLRISGGETLTTFAADIARFN